MAWQKAGVFFCVVEDIVSDGRHCIKNAETSSRRRAVYLSSRTQNHYKSPGPCVRTLGGPANDLAVLGGQYGASYPHRRAKHWAQHTTCWWHMAVGSFTTMYGFLLWLFSVKILSSINVRDGPMRILWQITDLSTWDCVADQYPFWLIAISLSAFVF